MLTRRDVLGTGFLGAVRPAPSAAHETVQALDREGLREISREIQALRTTFISVSSAHELPSPLIDRLREQMAQFLRSSGKFPDFCDVGYDVFYNVYDWHVKNARNCLSDGCRTGATRFSSCSRA